MQSSPFNYKFPYCIASCDDNLVHHKQVESNEISEWKIELA